MDASDITELSSEVQQHLASLHNSKSVTLIIDEIFEVVCEDLGKFGASISISDILGKITTGNF